MQFTSFLEEGRLTVALTGEIDHHCAKSYIQAIAAKIDMQVAVACMTAFVLACFLPKSMATMGMEKKPE